MPEVDLKRLGPDLRVGANKVAEGVKERAMQLRGVAGHSSDGQRRLPSPFSKEFNQ